MAILTDSLGRFYCGSAAPAFGGYVESAAPCDCGRCATSAEVVRLSLRVRTDGRTLRLSHARPESLRVESPFPVESREAAAARFLAAVAD